MSPEVIKELEAEMKAYGLKKAETPEEKESTRRAIEVLLLMYPGVREQFLAEGNAEGLRDGKAEGLRDGKAEGLRDGKAEGLRAAVTDLCELLGIELTGERQARLAALDLAGLTALRQHLKTHRTWPSEG
jgi:flagellar biosynthesis/type III secretory pathway protein FliH